MIVATHDPEFAAACATRAILMADGRVIADGSAAELLAGGWYFATETARILGGAGGALLAEQGAELLLGGGLEHAPAQGERCAGSSTASAPADRARARAMSWPLASFLLVGAVLAAGWLAYERRAPSARIAAVVAVMAAMAALGRDAFVALPDVKPITAMTFVVGYALGPLPGFTVGALGMLVSNFALGQGPYTPWEMAAWGMVGLAGALLGRLSRRRVARIPLALGCALAALAAKEVMNLYTWTLGASHTPGGVPRGRRAGPRLRRHRRARDAPVRARVRPRAGARAGAHARAHGCHLGARARRFQATLKNGPTLLSMAEHAYSYRAVRRRSADGLGLRSSPAAALAVAGLCLLALVLTWLIAEHVRVVQVKDWVLLHDFTLLSRPARRTLRRACCCTCSTRSQFILWGVALVAVALGRGRPRIALAVVAVMVARAAHRRDAQAAARASARRRSASRHIGAASWPSGHSTAARRSRCAPCSSRRRALRGARRGRRRAVRRRGRLRAADPRLAHAERRPRRLPGGDVLDRARRRRAARRRAALADAPAGRAGAALASSRCAQAADGSAPAPCAPGSHSGSERSPGCRRWRRG